jgi:RNA polymerase sigma-70 factor, ECF subfamily
VSEAAAFRIVYERTVDDVYSYLASRTGARAVAEDLTQEVYFAAAVRVRSGEPVDIAWLVAVARNKYVDHCRREARDERRLLALSGGLDEVDHRAAQPFEPGRSESALASLNTTYRLALVLRHVDGLSVPDVAHHLGRTVEAAEQVLARARVAFRHAYEGAIDA